MGESVMARLRLGLRLFLWLTRGLLVVIIRLVEQGGVEMCVGQSGWYWELGAGTSGIKCSGDLRLILMAGFSSTTKQEPTTQAAIPHINTSHLRVNSTACAPRANNTQQALVVWTVVARHQTDGIAPACCPSCVCDWVSPAALSLASCPPFSSYVCQQHMSCTQGCFCAASAVRNAAEGRRARVATHKVSNSFSNAYRIA